MKPFYVAFFILVLALLGFSVTAPAQTATITYTYDDLNRVTNVSYQGGITQTFTPNDAGNLTGSTVTTAPVDAKGVNATTWPFFGQGSSNDGIPDAWAYTYGEDWYDPNLGNESPENNGVTNFYAYQQDENPDNPNNPPPPATAAPAISTAGLAVSALMLLGVMWLEKRRQQRS